MSSTGIFQLAQRLRAGMAQGYTSLKALLVLDFNDLSTEIRLTIHKHKNKLYKISFFYFLFT